MPSRAIQLVRPDNARPDEVSRADSPRESAVFPRSKIAPDPRAYAAHDARNLLAIITLDVDFLRHCTRPTDGMTRLADDTFADVKTSLKKLRELVEAALSAEAPAGRCHPRYRTVTVGDILDAVPAASVHRRSLPHGVRVEVDAARDATVEVDPQLVSRVLANLLDNAIRHSPSGGTVRVTAHVRDAMLELKVEDHGCGVPEEMRQVIFEPYVSGGDGHGLGLAFCRDAIAAHGGRIHVEAAAPTGARFVVVLPTRPA